MKSFYLKAVAAIILIITCNYAILAQTGDVTEKKSTPKKAAKIKTGKICITFDNLPADPIYEDVERQFISDQILDALKAHDAPAAGFVIGEYIEGGWAMLVKWLEGGHTLGFMSYTGQDLNNVPVDIFIDDVVKGKEAIEDLVWSYKQKERYFRFAYLHYGSRPEIRRRVQDFLDESEITVAHASVVSEDFVYNLSLEKLGGSTDTLKYLALRDEYLSHILERLGHAETLANEVMGRSIRYILQLRANRLNAMFLDDMLSMLEKKGFSFISLKEALKDKVYRKHDAYYGTKGVSYLERIKYSDPDLLPAGD